jgi:DNA-binding response OmpR family regulator
MERGKVLIVDDEVKILEILSKFLLKKGYDVIVVDNGKDAIDKVKKEMPHLVLLDIKMPEMDGIEVLKGIKKIDNKIIVVMLTGVYEENIAKKCLELGAKDYITKPFNLDTVEGIIRYYCVFEARR